MAIWKWAFISCFLSNIRIFWKDPSQTNRGRVLWRYCENWFRKDVGGFVAVTGSFDGSGGTERGRRPHKSHLGSHSRTCHADLHWSQKVCQSEYITLRWCQATRWRILYLACAKLIYCEIITVRSPRWFSFWNLAARKAMFFAYLFWLMDNLIVRRHN